MSLFEEKYAGFFVANLPKALSVEEGKRLRKWEFGCRLTGHSKRNFAMTDGSPREATFAGFPWMEHDSESEMPGFIKVPFGAVGRGNIYFRRPTSLIFAGSCEAAPTSVYALANDIWPLAPVYGPDTVFLGDWQMFRYLAERGRIVSAEGLRVCIPDLDEDDLRAIHARNYPGFGTFLVASEASIKGAFPFRGFSPHSVPGVKILSLSQALVDGFTASEFRITNPNLAKQVHPFFGMVPKGAFLRPSLSSYAYFINADDASPSLLEHFDKDAVRFSFSRTGGLIIECQPSLIPSTFSCEPIALHDSDVLIGSSKKLLVPAKVAERKYVSPPLFHFWKFGDDKRSSSFFCRQGDLDTCQLLDVSRSDVLKKKYPWFNAQSDIGYTDAALALHDRFVRAEKAGWGKSADVTGGVPSILHRVTGGVPSILHRVAKKFFRNDTRVFLDTPLNTTALLYRPPSLELLSSNHDAHYAYLSEFRAIFPDAWNIITHHNAVNVLVSGDIAS